MRLGVSGTAALLTGGEGGQVPTEKVTAARAALPALPRDDRHGALFDQGVRGGQRRGGAGSTA